jgi:hypothetical protein
MQFTIESIYASIGRDDRVADVFFKNESPSYTLYGKSVTVVFLYTQREREILEEEIKAKPFSGKGFIKAKPVGQHLVEGLTDRLKTEGINSSDIEDIWFYTGKEKNTFHSTEKRSITKINVPIQPAPGGRDLDWMYGFRRKEVMEGIGLSPEEMGFYLAGRLYYESESITSDERSLIYDADGVLKQEVEYEFLGIKYQRGEITQEDKRRLLTLFRLDKRRRLLTLDKYLTESGSSLRRLAEKNSLQAYKLSKKVIHYKQRRLNVDGKIAIYIDLDSFLHIYMRHVQEMKVNNHFEHKDNFQWEESDVINVLSKVINSLNGDIQFYMEKNPGKNYSRYGEHSPYYQGDYYTFHIAPTGRLMTFHKNTKEHEKKEKKS